ncbi:Hypoxia up-regulated protein 1 [Cyphellophora attinorum]|uniref:Hypoxia up-regulated protein 1 n=1 Tax=Cyphellophora attinorum TaxID=1664694 RepID=A0A0N0NQH3_9EURO|nr:Hypoxia up-regulated protein 1 [Phialophora attinorum]KPI43908.1 Hypoxia up-regulated protein 1 [Phialophora attinorum]
MAPPGRRKPSLLLSLFTLFILCSSASAAAAVLGIDIGTSYIKAGIANPGHAIDVVLTKDTKRKEAAALAFKPSRTQSNDKDAFPERLYGSDARSRFPEVELVEIPRGESSKEATVGIKSKSMGTKAEPYMVEELLAMELKNMLANAEAVVAKGVSVNNVVITYPSFYTAQEKRAIELAADLAGLRVLSLISDGAAVGLQYATTRTFESVNDGAKPEYHVIYDMGAGSTTATVLKFQGRTIKTAAKRNQTIQEVVALGTAHDRTLGGDSLTDVIVADLVHELVQSKKAQSLGVEVGAVRESGKAMARIWKEAERLRQTLSINPAAYASMEGLYHDDINFKYSVTRDRFEELTLDHAGRVKGPLVSALEAAGITLAELDSVILHGGAIRTPFVQKQLELAVGDAKKIRTNVNADEAAVLGATFQAAAVSPGFRVKDIRVHDISGSPFTLKWTVDGKERQQKLFTPLSQIATEKQVPLKVLEDTKFEFVQGGDVDTIISNVEATNLTKSIAQLKEKYGCTPSNISTVFRIRLSSLDGLPEVVSGSVSCESDGSKDGGVLDNVKGLFGFGGKKEQATLIEDVDDPASIVPEPVDDPTSSASTISSASPSESGSALSEESATKSSSKEPATPTPSVVVINLALRSSPFGLNAPPEKALPQVRQRLTDFDTSDRNIVLRADANNLLEAFTYEARNYLEDDSFIAVSSKKARDKLAEELSAASDWLYGDGVDAKLKDIKEKLKGLRSQVDPVLKRISENSKRDDAVKALQDGLKSMKGTMEMVESSVKKAAEDAAASASSASAAAKESPSSTSSSPSDDLDDDPYSSASSAADPSETESDTPIFKPYEYSQADLDSLTKVQDSVQKWLDDKLKAQKKLGPYDDPAVLVSELEAKGSEVQKEVTNLLMKSIKMNGLPKKPKAGKKPKTAKPKKSAKTTASTSASESSETVSTKSIKDEL